MKPPLFQKVTHEANLSCWSYHNKNMGAISCHIFHTSSPHGLYKGHQSLLGEGIPFLLKKLDELFQISCRMMVIVNVVAKCIQDVLGGLQIWWSSWPVHSINLLLLQKISDDVSMAWCGLMSPEPWLAESVWWEAARSHLRTWLLSNCPV